jgi:hypothetical protein
MAKETTAAGAGDESKDDRGPFLCSVNGVPITHCDCGGKLESRPRSTAPTLPWCSASGKTVGLWWRGMTDCRNQDPG